MINKVNPEIAVIMTMARKRIKKKRKGSYELN